MAKIEYNSSVFSFTALHIVLMEMFSFAYNIKRYSYSYQDLETDLTILSRNMTKFI